TESSPPAMHTLSLHDALPIYELQQQVGSTGQQAMHLLKEGSQLMVLMQMHQGVAEAYYRLGAKGQLQKLQFQHIAHSEVGMFTRDRKSTRLNSSHVKISYAVF